MSNCYCLPGKAGGLPILFKKVCACREQLRSVVLMQHHDWFARQLNLDPRKQASTNLARKGGRCRRGRRLRVGIPHGHHKTIALVAGLRLSGLMAQKAFDQPMNTATFVQWVENVSRPHSIPSSKLFCAKIAERSVAGLMNVLQTCADIFKPVECQCGYDID